MLYEGLNETESRKIEMSLIRNNPNSLNSMCNLSKRSAQSKSICKIDVNTLCVIEEFHTMARVKDKYGFTPIRISDCCNRKQMMAYGFYWCFKEDLETFTPLDKRTSSRKLVKEKDNEGNVINVYCSLTEAAKANNVSIGTISQWINGKTKCKSNWEFIYDNNIVKDRTNSNKGKGRKYACLTFTNFNTKEIFTVSNLKEFAQIQNLDVSSIYKSLKNKKMYKNWIIELC